MTGSSRPQVVTTDNANFQAMLTAADLANQIAVNGLLAVDGANQVIGTVPDLVKAQTTAALIPLNSAVAGALASQVTDPKFISGDASMPVSPTNTDLTTFTGNIFGSRMLASGARQPVLWNRGNALWGDYGQPGATKADTDAAALPGQKALAVVSYATVAAMLADTALGATQPALADGSRWTPTTLADDGGTVMTAVAGRLKREGLSFVAPEMFPTLFAATDKAGAINAALRNSQGKPVLLTGDYTIRSKVSVPVTASLTGVGTTTLRADFSSWTGENVALDILTADRVYYASAERNREVGRFKVIGSANADRLSVGVRFRSPLTAIPASLTVQAAAIMLTCPGLYVQGFDTGCAINELWQSRLDLRIEQCRVGVGIAGSVVNVRLPGLQVTNPGKANTNSAAQTYGLTIGGASRYSADGVTPGTLYVRPEGLSIPDAVLFGADTNLLVQDVLDLEMPGIIADGATGDSVDIGGGELIDIAGYIYTSATKLTNKPTRDWSPVVIRNSATARRSVTVKAKCIGAGTSKIGIYVEDGAGLDNCLTLSGDFDGFERAISMGVVKGATVRGVTGRNLSIGGVDWRGGNVRGGLCDDVRISGTVPPLTLGGGLTGLAIGTCTSDNYRTRAAGVVTMNSGATSANITTGAYASETGWRMLTTISPAGNLGSVWVDVDTAGSNNPIAKCSAAPGADTKVRWISQAVPLSEF